MTVHSSSHSETADSPTARNEAWSAEDLARDPHQDSEKAGKVRSMFSAIAGKYDLNNRLHSFGRDQAWRRKAVQLAQPKSGDVVLDVACGTGDLTMAFASAGVRRVVGVDFTPAMLEIARKKNEADNIVFEEGDATDLQFEDASFDVVSIAFGIRNVSDTTAALREFYRVLRPNGRLVILEFSQPSNRLVRFGNNLYCRHLMPLTATLIARDRSGAYRYLPRSIETYLEGPEMLTAMGDTGFIQATQMPMTFGVCSIYLAHKLSAPD